MKDKIKEIENQIEFYYSAKNEIESIRQQIAEEKCPLKIGDIIEYEKNGKIYKGKVDKIIFVVKKIEYLGPLKNNEVGWGVNVNRILKTTGKLSSISFCVNEFHHFLKDDIWREEDLTGVGILNRLLDI